MSDATDYNELIQAYVHQPTLDIRQEVGGEPPTIETVFPVTALLRLIFFPRNKSR